MDESKDILNVFRAYPEMEAEGILRRTRHIWLFDQVIPHLVPWISRKCLIYCRQVCNAWCHGVDNFLENHPTNRAYSHGNRITGQVWIPEASPKHTNLWEYFRGVKTFNKTELFAHFLQDMDRHPPDRNPFVGRAINITDYRLTRDGGNTDEFWEGALQLLEGYGHHIWFLEVHHYANEDARQFAKLVLDLVDCTPNLKGLTLAYHYHIHGAPGYDSWIEDEGAHATPIPLPHLESLQLLHRVPQSLVNYLVTSYSNQIRRLNVRLTNWRKGNIELFPKLTELTILEANSKEDVEELLTSLDAPVLFKLDLRMIDPSYCVGVNLVQWLKKFTRLSELVLICPDWPFPDQFGLRRKGQQIREVSGGHPSNDDGIPSLKYVKIHGDLRKVNFKFLNSFPSLELLQVMSSKRQKYFDGSKIYERGIWELLPKLRSIFMCGAEYGSPDFHLLYCTRARYELFKLERSQST